MRLLFPPVVVFSIGPIMESLPSGDPSKSLERPLREHGISSSRVVQSDSSLIDSHVELGFVAVTPWPNQVDVQVSDLDEVD